MNALINHNVNNLNGGISTQPDEKRFDNQVDSMVNCVPSPTGRLVRRNGLTQIANIQSGMDKNHPIHSYDRGDGLEKYGMFIYGSQLWVYDSDGNQKTVNVSGTSPVSYWNDNYYPSTSSNIKFLTVGDTTFILNTKVVVQQSSLFSSSYSQNRAFYWAKRSFDDGQGSGYDYEIVLDGTKYSVNSTSTLGAINAFPNAVGSGGTHNGQTLTQAGFAYKISGSIIKISHPTSTFTFESGDSWGNQASVGWVDSIAKISDLPSKMDGFDTFDVGIVKITGTDRNEFTEYYLKWDNINSKWVETLKGGIYTALDYTSLPAKLVRESNGTFTLSYITGEWEERKVGDNDSNPFPSFAGNTISNMFFFKNRLCFTSGENVIMSEVGEYFNFFATTVLEVLDSDPIDVSVDSDNVALIRNANAMSGSVTLWADNAQFVLSGGDVLSPLTTRISKTSSYACDNSISPIELDNEIMFFRKVGDRFDVMVYSPASVNTDKSTAESLSSHVVGYLPDTINNAVASSASNMVFFTDSASRSKLYVYRYFVRNNERIMSAWFEWEFGLNQSVSIKNMAVLSDVLYLTIDKFSGGGTYDAGVYKIELDEKSTSSSCLDEVVQQTTGSYVSYDSSVVMSKFNIETQQGTRVIREPFYMKHLKTSKDGNIDMQIIDSNRNTTTTIDNDLLDRKIFVGSNTENTNIGYKNGDNNNFSINAISIEGMLKSVSKNI